MPILRFTLSGDPFLAESLDCDTWTAEHEYSKTKKKRARRHGRPRKDKTGSSSWVSSVPSTTSSAALTPVRQRSVTPHETFATGARDNSDLEATPTTTSGRLVGGKSARSRKSSPTKSRSQHDDSAPESELSHLTREQQKSQTVPETSDPPEPSATWTAMPLVETVRPNATESLGTDVPLSSAGKDCDADMAAQDDGGQRPLTAGAHSSTGSAIAAVKPVERTSDSTRSSRRSSAKVFSWSSDPIQGLGYAGVTASFKEPNSSPRGGGYGCEARDDWS
ncbi:hypothetical protein MRX96_014063 [Rhipicephalus microplus]